MLRDWFNRLRGGYVAGGVVEHTAGERCIGCQSCVLAIRGGVASVQCPVCGCGWYRVGAGKDQAGQKEAAQ